MAMTHYLSNSECLLSPNPTDIPSGGPSRPIKLGILASGSGSNFEAIAQAIAEQRLNAHVQVVIYNNPNAKVCDRAQTWNVPAQLLNHRDYPHREALDAAIVKTLHTYEVEWVIMAGWMRIVTPVLLDAFPNRVLNIHPSLLPSFPGAHAIEEALAKGVKVSGCTVHYVVPEVDSGPIIIQAVVPVLPNDDVASLHARIQIQEHRIFPLAIQLAALENS
jgi:phosphoribosylglycinamide formyltransferase 1